MKKQIIKNIFSNYLLNFLQMSFGILIVPFLIFKLGKDAFGLIILSESVIGILEMLATSIRISLSRHATVNLAKNDERGFLDYLGAGKYILNIICFIVLMAGFLISISFSHIFKVPYELRLQSSTFFILISLGFVVSIPMVIYWSALYAKERFDLINRSSSSAVVLRAILIFFLFLCLPKQFQTLTTYAFIYLIVKVYENVMIYIQCNRLFINFNVIGKYDAKKIKEILSFSGHTTLINISTLLYENTSNILINILYGPSLNAIYAVSLKIPSVLKAFFLRATWALHPTITHLTAKNDGNRLKSLFFLYSKVLSIVLTPLTIFVILFSREIICIWVGKDFREASFLLIIHMIPILLIPLAIVNGVPNAFAKLKIPSLVSIFFGIINLTMGFYLSLQGGMKLMGFAIASSICMIIVSGVFMPYYACKLANISLKEYLFSCFLRPLALSVIIEVPIIVVSKLGASFLQQSTLFVLLAFVYFIISYFILLVQYERDLIIDVLRKKIRKNE